MLEELGSDAHVIFPVDAPRVEAEDLRSADEEEALIGGGGSAFTARVDARTGARVGEPLRLSVDPVASTGSIPRPARACAAAPLRLRTSSFSAS